MAQLHIQDLSFRYPKADCDAVKDVDLSLESGDFVLLMGETGCGKSTLLRLIKREIAPHGTEKGTVYLNGAPVTDSTSEIGFVFQNPAAQSVLSCVADEIAFGLENMALTTEEIDLRMGECVAFFGIENLLRRRMHELSGGEVQLVNLAAVMAMRPRILLLDEPTSHLDPISANRFLDLLHRLHTELGVTVLIAEHHAAPILAFADRVAYMEGGTLRFCLPTREACAVLPAHMLASMPAAVRLWRETGCEGPCPLNAREGAAYFHHRRKREALPPTEENVSDTRSIVLEARNLRFRYEKNTPDVLCGASLSLAAGEVFALLGSNGGGKSTLLSVLSGASRPYMGTVNVLGRPVKSYRHTELYEGVLDVMPQDPMLVIATERVRADFEIAAGRLGMSDGQLEAHLAAFGISTIVDRHPADLSGGELQMCAVALTMLSAPKILLLDEPTKGLDATARARLGEQIKKLAASGVSVLFVTHDIAFAAAYADRCAMLSQGRIVAEQDTGSFLHSCLFYTSDAHRICSQIVTAEELIALCREETE